LKSIEINIPSAGAQYKHILLRALIIHVQDGNYGSRKTIAGARPTNYTWIIRNLRYAANTAPLFCHQRLCLVGKDAYLQDAQFLIFLLSNGERLRFKMKQAREFAV
jgi:hypothetical protein